MVNIESIKKELNTCGDCPNLQLMVWDSDAENVNKKPEVNWSRETDSYYSVRCRWAKQAIVDAKNLINCHGKNNKKG